MAADVATKVFPSEPIRNGYAITAVDQSGNFQRVAPNVIEDQPLISGISVALDDRFDNPTYYSN